MRDDYTHNHYFVACALYTNWASIDSFQFISLLQKLDAHNSKVLALDAGLPRIKSSTDAPQTGGRDGKPKLNICLNVSREGMKYFTPTPLLDPSALVVGAEECWDIEQERLIGQLNNYVDYLEIQKAENRRQEIKLKLFDKKAVAALAVPSLGTPVAGVQLLVCLWKANKDKHNERAKPILQRNLIILLGLVLPSSIQFVMPFYYQGFEPDRIKPIILTEFILFVAAGGRSSNKVLTDLLPNLGQVFSSISGILYTFVFKATYLSCATFLRYWWLRPTLRCVLMPCTTSKITELDQSFALFSSLLLFLYDFNSLFFGFLQVFAVSIREALVQVSASSHDLGGSTSRESAPMMTYDVELVSYVSRFSPTLSSCSFAQLALA